MKKEWKKYKKEKEPPRCNLKQLQQYKKNREYFLGSTIIPFVKNKGDIIYGSRAMNIQLPKHLRRTSDDYDIWSKKPALHCDQLEDKLDKKAGCNMFIEEKKYITKAGKTTYRIRYLPSSKQEVDYTKPPKDAKIKKIKGVNYQHIKHQKKRLKEMAKDPLLAFRIEKTMRDLKTIEKAEGKQTIRLFSNEGLI